MSKQPFIPSWLDDSDLTPAEFRVFCRIVRRGECWESIVRMGAALGMSKDTVRKCVGSLRQKGLVTVEKRKNGLTNVIRPNPDQGHPLTLDRVTPPNPREGHKGSPSKGSPKRRLNLNKRKRK